MNYPISNLLFLRKHTGTSNIADWNRDIYRESSGMLTRISVIQEILAN